jgi:hypothetical protein
MLPRKQRAHFSVVRKLPGSWKCARVLTIIMKFLSNRLDWVVGHDHESQTENDLYAEIFQRSPHKCNSDSRNSSYAIKGDFFLGRVLVKARFPHLLATDPKFRTVLLSLRYQRTFVQNFSEDQCFRIVFCENLNPEVFKFVPFSSYISNRYIKSQKI